MKEKNVHKKALQIFGICTIAYAAQWALQLSGQVASAQIMTFRSLLCVGVVWHILQRQRTQRRDIDWIAATAWGFFLVGFGWLSVCGLENAGIAQLMDLPSKTMTLCGWCCIMIGILIGIGNRLINQELGLSTPHKPDNMQ